MVLWQRIWVVPGANLGLCAFQIPCQLGAWWWWKWSGDSVSNVPILTQCEMRLEMAECEPEHLFAKKWTVSKADSYSGGILGEQKGLLTHQNKAALPLSWEPISFCVCSGPAESFRTKIQSVTYQSHLVSPVLVAFDICCLNACVVLLLSLIATRVKGNVLFPKMGTHEAQRSAVIPFLCHAGGGNVHLPISA